MLKEQELGDGQLTFWGVAGGGGGGGTDRLTREGKSPGLVAKTCYRSVN